MPSPSFVYLFLIKLKILDYKVKKPTFLKEIYILCISLNITDQENWHHTYCFPPFSFFSICPFVPFPFFSYHWWEIQMYIYKCIPSLQTGFAKLIPRAQKLSHILYCLCPRSPLVKKKATENIT